MKDLLAAGLSGLRALIDTILPERARTMRTRKRALEDIPLAPESHVLFGAQITTLMDYRNPAVQDLVRTLKYDGSAHAAHLAAGILTDYLREEIASHSTFSAQSMLITPVPLHKSRARERGWNQIELVVKALPEEFRNGSLSSLAPEVLARTRATQPQTRLPRSERLSNVAGAFACSDTTNLRGAHVLLVDDVTTTGATLTNAATPLRRAGARVSLLALARA